MSGIGRGLVATFVMAGLIGLGVGAPAAADEVVGTVTSNDPLPVAVDTESGLAYVGSSQDAQLSVLSPNSNSVVDVIDIPGPAWGIAIDSATHTAYVAEKGGGIDDEVFVVDLVSGAVTARIPGFKQPVGLAFDAGSERLYVPNFFGATVSVVDTPTQTVVAEISVGDASVRPTAVSLDPSVNRAFVSLQTQNDSVAVINTETNLLVESLPIPVVYWTATDPATHQLYASSHGQLTPVYVYDTETLVETTQIRPTPENAPYGIAVDAANGRLYVGRTNDLLIVATADNSILQRVPITGNAFRVAASPAQRMAFATSGGGIDTTWLIGGPMARVAPDELVFPKSQTQQTGFVRNAGRLPMTVTGLSLNGPDADRFTIDDTTCTQTPMAVGDSCNVTIGVQWSDERPLTASLVVASDDIDADRGLPLRTVLDPAPTPTPTATPTPSPTVTPTPVTELVVKARPHRKALSTTRSTTVVRSVRANSAVRVTSTCLLRGQRVAPQVQKRLCQVTTTARRSERSGVVAPGAVGVRVQPFCSGVQIRVKIRARAEGAAARTWERTWRADPTPRVECSLPGTG